MANKIITNETTLSEAIGYVKDFILQIVDMSGSEGINPRELFDLVNAQDDLQNPPIDVFLVILKQLHQDSKIDMNTYGNIVTVYAE